MFGQFIINGLITGVLYSLLAIVFVLDNTLRVFHITVAGIYVFAVYMSWLFSNAITYIFKTNSTPDIVRYVVK